MTTTHISNRNQLRAALSAAGGEHLGDVTGWRLRMARVARAELEAIWAAEGLPMDVLPPEKEPEKALSEAVKEARPGRPTYRIEKSLETRERISYAVLLKKPDGHGNLATVQEARIDLDRATSALSSDHPEHFLVAEVHAKYVELRTTHVADDVRATLTATIGRFAGFPILRDGGGVYFIPNTYAAELRALARAVGRIGESAVGILELPATARNQTEMGAEAQGAIERELEGLHAEIQGWLDDASTEPKRVSTLEKRLAEFEALRARARLYRGILAVEVKDLDGKLDALAGTVERIIARKQDELGVHAA
jgi:hypothetical protein